MFLVSLKNLLHKQNRAKRRGHLPGHGCVTDAWKYPIYSLLNKTFTDLGLRNCGLLHYYYLQLYIDKQRLSLVIYLYYSAKSKSSNKCRCCNSTCSSPTSMKVIQCALSSGEPGLQESLQKNVLNYFVCKTNRIASVTTEETLAYIILCLKLNLENHKFMQPLLYCRCRKKATNYFIMQFLLSTVNIIQYMKLTRCFSQLLVSL